jgi:oligopeptide/dipeptide ABC transporter ATP-binding protein
LTAILSVTNLTVALDAGGAPWPVLDRVSLGLEQGEARALVGESGGGKTMFARAVLRLLPPRARIVSGDVRVAGRDLLRLSEGEMTTVRGGAVGYVFQEPLAALDPVRTVGAQVAEAVHLHSPMTPRQAASRAVTLLEEAGLPQPGKRYGQYPHELSGGMRQRVTIAAALAGNPGILIADEPTASLDPPLEAQVLDLLERLRRDRGLSVLLITHDLRMAADRCDRVSVLYAGRIVEETTADEFRRNPLHPYSVALAACAGESGAGGERIRGERLPVIPGRLPALPERSAPRCAFFPRCTHAFERCGAEDPPLYAAGDSRARCFLFAPEAA